MRFPEGLYQLSEYDVSKASWAPQRIAGFAQGLDTQIQFTTNFGPVPQDRIFVLTSATLLALAGTGQVADGQTIRIRESDLALVAEIAQHRNAVNSIHAVLNFSGEVVLMPGELLTFVSNFNVLTLANAFSAGFTGILIPRANWQRGTLPSV